MANNAKTILVTGATGRQGGAVARRLLDGGWNVRALTRDPQKPAARELAQLGAHLFKGDLNDRDSLEEALEAVYGVFSVQSWWEVGVEGEIREGKTLADAAKAAAVKHFIYSSVGGADCGTGIPFFESKWEIEQYVRSRDLPATILRPVFFMENFAGADFRQSILNGTLAMPMRPAKPLQMIAVEDIGAFAAMAFEVPDRFMGQAMELAGDEKTMPQVTELFAKAIGRPVRYVEVPLVDVEKARPEYASMFKWFNEVGYKTNIPALRDMYPDLTNFQTWLLRTGWHRAGKVEAA